MAHPTREALLRAGLRLAETSTLSSMSVNAIVAEAGVAKGTFYVHFADRAEYLVALHGWFHDGLRATMLAGAGALSPGRAHLLGASTIYLDACLGAQAVKAILLEARSEPAIVRAGRQRNGDFAELARADFAAMGWPEPLMCAQLYVVMVAEVALLELEAGAALPAARQTLAQFLER